MVICSDHKPLWRDSYKCVGQASTSPKSILHKIIIINILIKKRIKKKSDILEEGKTETAGKVNAGMTYITWKER